MRVLRAIGSELLGLFVDDWAFALLLIAWVVLFALLGPHQSPVFAAIFFAGIALLTLVFVRRKARR